MTILALNVSRWWIPAAIAAIVTGIVIFVPGMWWFVFFAMLLAFCLVGAAYAGKTVWIVFFYILTVAVAVVGLIVFNPAMQAQFTPESVTVTAIVTLEEPPAEVAPVECTEVVVSEAMETPVPVAEVTPEPTEIVEVTPVECTEAKVVESQTHGGKVLVDLNDGDPFDYSLTIVSPNTPSGSQTLVVLTEPGYIFDVVYEKMYFVSYRLQGTPEEVLCSVEKLAGNAKTYVYVGKSETPEGWETVSAEGWWTELVEKQYSEAAITPGGEWTSYQIEAESSVQVLKATELTYGQLWKSSKPGYVVHFQIEPGDKFTIPAYWQGTYWTVVGGDPEMLQDRFIQASKEVVERDDLSIISGHSVVLFFCGETAPETYLQVENASIGWTDEIALLNYYQYDQRFQVEDLDDENFAGWNCQPTETE